MNRLSDLYGRLLDFLAVIAALLLLAMVIIVTGDILLRNLANKGFVWANEVSEYSLYLITLLTAPWLLRRGQHVRLDLILTSCRSAAPGCLRPSATSLALWFA